MKKFITYIIKALVDKPESVMVSAVYGRSNVIIEVRCHTDDMGRVIGKNGKTIGAMRMLLSGLAARQKRKAVLEIVE